MLIVQAPLTIITCDHHLRLVTNALHYHLNVPRQGMPGLSLLNEIILDLTSRAIQGHAD
jgi:GTP cyclohydrolase I